MKVRCGYSNSSSPSDEMVDIAMIESTGENAEPTSRLLDGSEDHGYAEEWQEPAAMPNGDRCLKMYLFASDEITNEDGEPLQPEDYPWDDEHVRRVVIVG